MIIALTSNKYLMPLFHVTSRRLAHQLAEVAKVFARFDDMRWYHLLLDHEDLGLFFDALSR
jgi:hypothetical protein